MFLPRLVWCSVHYKAPDKNRFLSPLDESFLAKRSAVVLSFCCSVFKIYVYLLPRTVVEYFTSKDRLTGCMCVCVFACI